MNTFATSEDFLEYLSFLHIKGYRYWIILIKHQAFLLKYSYLITTFTPYMDCAWYTTFATMKCKLTESCCTRANSAYFSNQHFMESSHWSSTCIHVLASRIFDLNWIHIGRLESGLWLGRVLLAAVSVALYRTLMISLRWLLGVLWGIIWLLLGERDCGWGIGRLRIARVGSLSS